MSSFDYEIDTLEVEPATLSSGDFAVTRRSIRTPLRLLDHLSWESEECSRLQRRVLLLVRDARIERMPHTDIVLYLLTRKRPQDRRDGVDVRLRQR